MKVLIIGASKSGSSVCKLLLSKNYQVYITDINIIDNKEELVALGALVYEGGHPELLKDINYDFIVKNPGIPYTVEFVKYFTSIGYLMYNEIEIANRFVEYKYGAITGTNGKTTTTTILKEFVKKLNPKNDGVGNIGKPLSELVIEYPNDKLTLAIEVAGFQLLGMPKFKPTVSTIMNLTPDHLNYFNSIEDYYQSKCLIYKNQDKNDYFIKNIDDENIIKYVKNINCNILTLSLNGKADLMIKDNIAYYKDVKLFNLKDFKLVGKHNLYNALTAASMAYILGVSINDIQDVIKEFSGVEHRLEYVCTKNDVRYYNDSKGTNTDATIVALNAFDKPVILLAGGYDKETGFKDLVPSFNKIKTMIVFGETKFQLKELYPQAIIVETMEEAIIKASSLAVKKDIILLSPSCASWDQFENFEKRGEIFKNIVKKL
jgi:UDP-N-acetylmuramoylalanine--D-glutamate ligase